ncbi:MAG: hypothetical protein MUD16_09470 [Desulfobacterales bacterium]|nr:hypothetical protein [Desulfobacterales bacterium]
MDDPQKSAFHRPPTQLEDEEPIIELTEVVPESEQASGSSELEKNLLEFERRFGAGPGSPSAEDRAPNDKLPELDELEDLDFLEDEETSAPVAASSPATPADETLAHLEQHMDWLFAEETSRPAAGALNGNDPLRAEVIEISEFEEQFLDAEEIQPTAAAAPKAPEPEAEPELLDIEEEEKEAPDDERFWFDPPERPAPAEAGVEPRPLDVRAEASAPPDVIEAVVSAAAAAVAPAIERSAPAPAHPEGSAPALDVDSIPMDRLEAAVASVIARSYSGRIEAIIVQAIESAVAREIERLRNELLESEPGGKPL